MDIRQKVINAIHNRRERLRQLETARKSLEIAETNAVNADRDLGRQLKNCYGTGRSVVFDDAMYTVHECDDCEVGKFALTVVPCDFEILTVPKV